MDWSRVLAAAGPGLAAAAPHALVAAVETALRAGDPGARCTLLLADLRLDELRPFGARGPVLRIEGTEHGRCFAAQQVLPLPSGDAVVAPVSARGDRLGVIEVRLASDPLAGAGTAEGARRLGGMLAQALLAVERVTDVYRIVQRGRSLTLSAEMQWDLLPGRSLDAGYAVIAGQLEPAYSIVGDTYDWAADSAALTATLVDAAGAGMQAAGTVAHAVAALRNARREGADLAGMARMADQALHARYAGARFSSCVLMRLDPAIFALELVTAGSGTVIHVGRRGVRVLDDERDPPLGTEEDYPYRARTVPVEAGDRVIVVSDGLSEAQIEGAAFGEGLPGLVHGYRLLGPAEVARAVIRGLRAFHAGARLVDDAVVLVLDVTGRRRRSPA